MLFLNFTDVQKACCIDLVQKPVSIFFDHRTSSINSFAKKSAIRKSSRYATVLGPVRQLTPYNNSTQRLCRHEVKYISKNQFIHLGCHLTLESPGKLNKPLHHYY